MKTVKEAFEKAYGPLPEGATCHIGYGMPSYGVKQEATVAVDNRKWEKVDGEWVRDSFFTPWGPDISDRHASAFLGFFGPEYDKAVSE